MSGKTEPALAELGRIFMIRQVGQIHSAHCSLGVQPKKTIAVAQYGHGSGGGTGVAVDPTEGCGGMVSIGSPVD